MSIIVFILVGVAACAFTHKLFNGTGMGVAVDLAFCVTGAVMAGVLCSQIGATDATELTIVGIAGATVPLVACRTVFCEPRSLRHNPS